MISKNSCPDLIDFVEGEVILLDKPKGFTSFDMIREIKKSVHIKKIGHAGTLDPHASGLLILCTGRKTKMMSHFQSMYKVYVGEMCLGATTASFDLEQPIEKTFKLDDLTEINILKARVQFTGKISQVPPVYSALKLKGRSLYKYAKMGEEVIPEPREVEIFEFEIINIALPYIQFFVKCSKGTYIRSLVHDFGKALNNGAYLSALRRTAIGDNLVSDALLPDEFTALLNTKIINTI